MSSDDEEELCGHPLTSKDGECDRPAKYPDGRCGHHTDDNEYGGDDWQPAYEHGLYMDRSGYYQSQPEEDQKWIDAIVNSFLDEAPFTKDAIGKLEIIRQVAIDMHKKRRADEYIHSKGMAQTKEVGYHEEYGVIEEEQENVLHITADRLSRESRQRLKDIGVIGDSNDNAEEVGQSVIDELSGVMDEDE